MLIQPIVLAQLLAEQLLQFEYIIEKIIFNFLMQNYKIGSGLANLGNTCFFNAVVQSILYSPALCDILREKEHSSECEKEGWCVFCEMGKVWLETKKNRVYSPVNLINNLKKIFPKFRLGRQEDSHEFLRYLIQGMQEAETGKMGKDKQKNEKAIINSHMFKIFGGLIRTSIHCLNCNYKSLTEERYYQINIECQRSSSLQEGIKSFFKVDQLSGNNKYHCQKCKKHTNATKRFYLMTVPEVITFQFKRFTNSLRKIGKFIPFQKQIHLNNFLQERRKLILDLYAVIVHAGHTSYSGHYYAFVKFNDNWYRMDDSHVTKCSEEAVLSQNAYILFYRKVCDEKMIQKCKNVEKGQILSKDTEQKEQIQIKWKIDEKKHQNIQITNDTLVQQNEKNNEIINEEDDQEQSVQVPNLLVRRRSKEQALNQMSMQQMLLHYAEHLFILNQKMQKPNYRSLRNLRSLRKYQIAMKKRKLE